MKQFICDFGSRANISIARNSRHAVIVMLDDGKRTAIGLTPASLKQLADVIKAVATEIEADIAKEKGDA